MGHDSEKAKYNSGKLYYELQLSGYKVYDAWMLSRSHIIAILNKHPYQTGKIGCIFKLWYKIIATIADSCDNT